MPWAEVGGRQGSIPGLCCPRIAYSLRAKHRHHPRGQWSCPRSSQISWLKPLQGAPPAQILSACLYSAATWKPLASSHTSSTSALLTDHLCGVLGRRRRGGKRGWGWGRRQAGRRPLQRGKKKENTQKVGPGWRLIGTSAGALCSAPRTVGTGPRERASVSP